MDDGKPGESAWLGIGQYWPREPFRKFHIRKQRWAVLVCHRRAGKTVGCVADLVLDARFTKKQDARFAYVAPHFNQAKDVAWMYVKRLTSDIPGVQLNESELRADFPNGSRVRLYGADNPDRLRGLYLDGAILDEFADMRPSVWGEIIRPMLMDRKGWAAFIGTPKGRNNFHQIYERAKSDPQWFALLLRASESGLISPDEIEAARKELTPEQFEQELECSFEAAILGAYWGKELAALERSGRITEVDYDPMLPMHTAWDLGVGDSTAIWFFQVTGSEVRIIDHYENHGQGLPHYASVLASKPYRYGDDWVPHDARVKELGTGRTRIETLISLGRKPRIVPAHKIMDGINAVRQTLPNMWFDGYRCADGLEALRQYQAEFDEKGRTFKDAPKHDWTSHSSDAMRYLAIAYREIKAPPAPKPAVNPRDPMTMAELEAFYERKNRSLD
jgi:phage terminase large subunit